VAELARVLYPFGQRRSRLSAERCAQVLHTANGGALIEFNSVAPPPSLPVRIDTPKPVSTGSPAALSVAEPQPFQKRNRLAPLVITGVIAAALGAVGLHFALGSGGDKTSPVVPAAAVAPPAAVAVPTAAKVEAPAVAPAAPARAVASEAAAPNGEAPAAAAKQRPTNAAQRNRAAAMAAARAAAAAKTSAPAAKRPAAPMDDSEPDVGY